MPAKKIEPEPGNRKMARLERQEKTDAALLSESRGGDTDSYRVLVDRHLMTVLAIARRMLRDDAEAEDIAQEVMLRLWRNAASLEIDDAGVRPWLRRVTSNLCIDRLRAGKAVSVVEQVPERPAPPGQLRRLSEKDLAGRVDKALKALPARQRLALVLFHFEGLSQIEVGQAMGVSDEAVESLLARARRGLRSALKDEWRQLLPDADA